MGPISLISPIGAVGLLRGCRVYEGTEESGSPESGVQRTEDGGLRDELDIIQRNGQTKYRKPRPNSPPFREGLGF